MNCYDKSNKKEIVRDELKNIIKYNKRDLPIMEEYNNFFKK